MKGYLIAVIDSFKGQSFNGLPVSHRNDSTPTIWGTYNTGTNYPYQPGIAAPNLTFTQKGWRIEYGNHEAFGVKL